MRLASERWLPPPGRWLLGSGSTAAAGAVFTAAAPLPREHELQVQEPLGTTPSGGRQEQRKVWLQPPQSSRVPPSSPPPHVCSSTKQTTG